MLLAHAMGKTPYIGNAALPTSPEGSQQKASEGEGAEVIGSHLRFVSDAVATERYGHNAGVGPRNYCGFPCHRKFLSMDS